MYKKTKSIPVYKLPPGLSEGMIIARASFNGASVFEEVERSHRDGGFTFILQEKGDTHIEIDFVKHIIQPSSLIFIHPDQVHRGIAFNDATITTWIITVENIRPEYLKVLVDLAPVSVLPLSAEILSLIAEIALICIRLSERKNEKLHASILKESCNTLVALVASQYMALSKPAGNYSRHEVITKGFKLALEHNFKTIKSPKVYAGNLNVSTAYLNECIKNATGFSVSYHIQQRVVLEAKRLLNYSEKSIKEIAAELGYDDYSYFTRLFAKVAGMTPLSFRNQNHD